MKVSLRGELRTLTPAYGALLVISFFVAILALVPPLYLLQVHERVYTSRSFITLGFLTAIAVGLLISLAILTWVRSEICSRTAAAFIGRVEDKVFRASQMRQGGRAASARYVSDLQQIKDVLAGPFIPAVFDVFLSPLFIIVLFIMHPIFGALGLGIILALAGLSWLNQRVSRKPTQYAQEAQVAALEFSGSLARNTDAARAMGMIPGLTTIWRERQSLGRDWQARVHTLTAPIVGLVRLIRSNQIVLVTLVGAILYIDGALTSGTAFAALMILNRSVGPIESVIAGWRGFTNARDAFGRIEELIEQLETIKDRVELPRPEGHLTVTQLTLTGVGAKQPIVRDVSFSVGVGNILAIIGASGAGKSTLLKALANVYPVASGSVALDGHPLTHWDPDILGKYVGYLPQETELMPGTVAQNISRFSSHQQEDDLLLFEASRLAGVEDLIRQLPEGYNTQVGQGGFPLSGGQRQRLAFARAVYGRPSLVLLDEPYSALDARGEAQLMQSIAMIAQSGATVAIVTHKLNMLTHCDYVLVLQGGHVQAFGAREAILQRLPQSQSPLRAVTHT